MKHAIELRDVSFAYPGDDTGGCLKHISITVQRGQVVLLCGASGCGKTTLTRLINGLIPHYYEGELTGRILVEGQAVSDIPLYDTAKLVGSVFQNPRSQFFSVDTTGELVFCPENLGLPEEEIRRRLADTVRELQLENLMDRSMFRLSGGEKQRIACAGVSVAAPPIVVLDEPSSNLDMEAIEDLKDQIGRWKNEGKTVVIAEHRLHYLRDLADRILYMDRGEIIREYTAAELTSMPLSKMEGLGLRPVSLHRLSECPIKPIRQAAGTILRMDKFYFGYKNGPECLHIDETVFPEESVIAVIGRNGAGKSTLARCLCGLEKKCRGVLHTGGGAYRQKDRLKNIFMVLQDVNHQLFTESVLDEVLLSMPEDNIPEAERILQELNLLEWKDRHPMSLSGGQKQRVAIACAVASGRKYLILDEPTSGLDLLHMQKVADLIRMLQKKGITLLVITHDPEFILRCCTHVLKVEDGRKTDSYPLNEEGREKLLDFFTGAAEGRPAHVCTHAG